MIQKQAIKLTLFFSILFLGISIGQSQNVKINGDFRYRHESFNQENVDDFNRHQIRARVGITAHIYTDVVFIGQIASGENDAPFSTDQTLGGSFSSKYLWLDKAYVMWQPSYFDGLKLVGGKAPNPIYRPSNNQLEWNPDVHMEGLSASYGTNSSNLELFGTAFYYWMEQRAAGDNSLLVGGQGGFKYSTSDYKLSLGVGYHSYLNAKGNPTYYDSGNSFGNSVNEDGTYMYDYNLAEAFVEITAFNISLYVDVVNNVGIDSDNMAYVAGLSYKLSDWSFNYNYLQIEKDALIGVLNDPDFAGGVTDSKGHKANIAYAFSKSIVTDLTYIHSTMGIDDGEYYLRLQLAFNFNF